tara:strand:- start:1327 stop:5103 length:3777 start_codon:yes stop_codon:yes gene_type:complete
MARIERGPSFGRSRVQEQPEEDNNVATQTEQAFGLAGEDTAMSMDEYNRQQEEKRAQNEQTMLQEYLADDDAFYTEEYLRSLPANRMVDILYEEDRDLVSKYTDPQKAAENEFTLKEVPTAIAPYVRVVAKGAGFVTVKPLEGVEPIMEEGVTAQLAAAKKQEVTDEVSTGEATARKLTLRETHEAMIAELFKSSGIANDSFRARQLARDIVGDPNADSILESFGAADVLGVPSAIYGMNEAYRDGEANYQRGGDATGYVAPVAFGLLSAAEAIPVGGLLFKGGKRLLRGQSFRRAPDSPKTIDEINAEVDTRHAEYLDARGMTYEDYVNKADKKYNLDRAKQATAEVKKTQRKATRDTLKANQSLADDIMEDFIEAYETNNGVDIHKVMNGRKVIDYEKARGVSISRMQDLDLPEDQLSAEGFGKDGYRQPILNPDTIDPLIAVVADLTQEFPDMFDGLKKGKRKLAVKTKDGKTVVGTVKGAKEPQGLNAIEMLFEASVKGDIGDEKLEGLINSPRLYEVLEKHGLSLDEFVQTVVGAGSQAGRILQKHKQLSEAMKARKTPEQLAEEEMNEALKGMGPKMKGLKRFENVVRGAMVGTIATAMRNFEGFIIRAPMEGLTNLFTNAITAGAKGGLTGEGGLTTFMKENPFKNSFRTYGEMFRDRKGIAEYTDYILDREEFAPLMTRFYDQVNEIQKGLGRGEATSKAGKVADYTLSGMEDFVHFVNTPNRMQEFIARRTAFMDKLGQLTQREYGLDLVESINAGRIGDLINDAESLIGQNKRSFKELVADAGESALDITYANAPKNPFLRDTLKLFNKIPGGTFAIPFPRFMFKSMEYMYETTLGLPTAAVRRIMGMGEAGGKLVTAQGKATYNAEMAARGMAGWTAIGTTYLAAEAGFVTDDNKLRLPNGKAIDVTPQFPLAQLVYLGKAMQKLRSSEKDFFEWFDGRDFVGLFSGTNFRTNTGMGEFIDDMFQILGNEAKIGKAEATAESLGKFVANVGTSLLQPYQMVIDTERALGIRDTTMRSYSSDPDMTMGGSFVQGFTERFRARGFTGEEYTDAEDIDVEAGDAPIKQYATKPGGKDRGRLGSLVKMTLGLNIMDDMTEEQEFFKRYGYNDWDLSSRTGVGTVDNAINETLSGILPTLAQSLMDVEESMIERGDSDVIVKKELASRIKDQVNGIKQEIRNRGLRTAGANNPAFVEELFKLRTFNAEAQRIIVERFREANDGESPDLTDVGDLRALNEIGFRGRYGRSLFD